MGPQLRLLTGLSASPFSRTPPSTPQARPIITSGLGACWPSHCPQGVARAPSAWHSGPPTLSTSTLTTRMAPSYSPSQPPREGRRRLAPAWTALHTRLAHEHCACLTSAWDALSPSPVCHLKAFSVGPLAGDRGSGLLCACGLLPTRAQRVLVVGHRQRQSRQPSVPTQTSPCVSLNTLLTPGSLSILFLLHRKPPSHPAPSVCTC